MQVRVVDSLPELRALERSWDALLRQDEHADVFGTFDWVLQWWQSFAAPGPVPRLPLHADRPGVPLAVERAELHVIAVHDGARLAAVVPLLRATGRWRGRRLRVLVPPLNAHAPRSALPARPLAAQAMRAVIDHLAADPGWDVLLLDGIARSSPQLRWLVRAARERGLRCARSAPWSHSQRSIEGSWSEYLQRRGRHFRKHLGQAERSLARLGSVQVRCQRAAGEVESAMRAFLRIDAESWKAVAGESIGVDAALGAHYTALARAFAAKGACELWSLDVAGEPAAACLALVHGSTLYTLKTSYRRSFASASLSPGLVLFARILEDAWQGKRAAVDFVGRTPFSERWTDDAAEFAPLAVVRARWLPLAAGVLERIAQLRRALRQRSAPWIAGAEGCGS